MRIRSLLMMAAVLTTACQDGGGVVSIDDSTGAVVALTYMDRDANGERGPNDVAIAGVRAALVRTQTGDTVAAGTSGVDGSVILPRVPVGQYRLYASRGALGDSVDVLDIDDATVMVALGDTAVREIRVGYPPLTLTAARALPSGQRTVVSGIALNAWSTFGDSTVHLLDATGALRAVRLAASGVQAGDSVRVIASTGERDGEFVLTDGVVQVLAEATLPVPDSMATADAAAGASNRDGQARVVGVVSDTASVDGDFVVGVTDGSGRLEVVLDSNIGFGGQPFVPGAVLAVSGLLVPDAASDAWRLKPRAATEALVSFPSETIAGARALPAGRRVYVTGIALHAWSTFGDSTLHVQDATGSVRIVGVLPTGVQAGDSVRVLGLTGTLNGRFVLSGGIAEDLGARTLPAAPLVSTAAARTGSGHEDGQVRLAGAIIMDTTTANGDRVVGVDDGSGRVELVLDASISFGAQTWSPGATFDGGGILVPGGAGTWQVKPRSAAEAVVSVPAVSIATARALPQGLRTAILGVALNAWASFGDSTLHVQDATGAVRAIRVAPVGVQTGDSIYLIATTGMRDGEFVLTNGIAQVIEDVGVPAADSVSTAAAAAATDHIDGQVRVAGALVLDTATVGSTFVLGVDDGSGRLEVVLDGSIAWGSGPWVPDAVFAGTGVLVPDSAGGAWQLKPRALAETSVGFPVVTVADARALPPGRTVYIEGTALNGWSTFGDSILHVEDATGAARVLRVAPVGIVAGDEVRVLATTGTQGGRFVLTDGIAQDLGTGSVPTPDSVSTATAAAGGANVDGQVRVAGATIADTATVNGDFILGIDDGSGRLEVALDGGIAWGAGPWAPQAIFTGSGVLVPGATAGTWRLKPRSVSETTTAFPTVTTIVARGLPAGTIVGVVGIALNGRTTFGDSTVHVQDAAGALRAVQVAGTANAGDSVRIVGVLDVRNGQPVLANATATVLASSVGLATPDSLAAAVMATADGGARDAGQAQIGGKIIGIQPQPNGDQIVLVEDASGIAEVVLDDDIAFGSVGFAVGAILRSGGVLVPTGSGTWQLKPRGATDASVTYPTVTIAEARALPAGEVVYVYGIALNSRITFGDGSVHIADATGALRVQPTPGVAILAGDSVRFLGTTAVRAGQPILNATQAVVLLTGVGTDAPDSISTATAATADAGALDADHAVIAGTVMAIGTSGGNEVLTVDDGTGPLSVVLDPDAGFTPGVFAVGHVVRAEGLLVASTAVAGQWALLPRALDEIVVVP